MIGNPYTTWFGCRGPFTLPDNDDNTVNDWAKDLESSILKLAMISEQLELVEVRGNM